MSKERRKKRYRPRETSLPRGMASLLGRLDSPANINAEVKARSLGILMRIRNGTAEAEDLIAASEDFAVAWLLSTKMNESAEIMKLMNEAVILLAVYMKSPPAERASADRTARLADAYAVAADVFKAAAPEELAAARSRKAEAMHLMKAQVRRRLDKPAEAGPRIY